MGDGYAADPREAVRKPPPPPHPTEGPDSMGRWQASGMSTRREENTSYNYSRPVGAAAALSSSSGYDDSADSSRGAEKMPPTPGYCESDFGTKMPPPTKPLSTMPLSSQPALNDHPRAPPNAANPPSTNETPPSDHRATGYPEQRQSATPPQDRGRWNHDRGDRSQSNFPTQHQKSPQYVTDMTYTTCLHWRHRGSSPIRKRPIDLPNDVEHISEVEWADEAPAATHQSRNVTPPVNTANICSIVTAVEKAPRPKSRRPEPCFCEPDLVTQRPCCVDTSCALFACQEECPNNCAAGPLCGNKRIQRREWKRLSVFDAGLKGRGLMVQEHCNRFDFIVEYVGVAVKKQYLDGLFNRYRHERMLYIMALDNDIYIDARHRGGIARYINHSCEPNCAVHRWKVKGISRAGVFAIRDIQEGEELSFDYQWERKRGRALTKCHCGSINCRRTIEESEKDGDERNLGKDLEELEGQWFDPSGRVGKDIMNRVVKVYFPNADEHYIADVAMYDEKTGKHLLMYRGDPEEHWTDLSKEKWMLLEEVAGEKFAIKRKHLGGGMVGESLIVNPPDSSGLSSNMTSPRSDFSRSSSPVPNPEKARNCIYIQTPVKDAMMGRHTLFKCGRYCRVHIDTVNITVQKDAAGKAIVEGEDDDYLKEALENSEDGMVWKLVITGLEVKKAIDWLEKIAASIISSLNGTEALASSSAIVSKGSSNALVASAASAGGVPGAGEKPIATELVIPRVITDIVKKKYFSLKGYCYNVEVSFSHSDSKSKQFAKLTLAADVGADMDRALEYLYTELTQMCLAAGAPMTSIGVYKDLGFLGGELSSKDFELLFERNRTLSRVVTTDCCEDLEGSTFARSFMEVNRCSIWVQAEEDMGRVSNNRVINESYSNKPRRIFFGVAPNRVLGLWGQLRSRLHDLHRGVQFLHLGSDRIYQPALLEPIRRNGRPGCNYFFDFVRKTSGASVRVDSVTGSSHLRIDGGDTSVASDEGIAANEKIDIAMELISLQIELLRDHHIRKQRWGFGRDWALLLESDHAKKLNQALASQKTNEASAPTLDATTQTASKSTSTADSLRLSDPRAVGTACLEISEMVTGAGLSEKVAAHACIIFYRYINLVLPSGSNNTANALNSSNFKLRDVQLASLFIANKSQKVVKWKRLEAVLEHAYRVFYPGSVFDPGSEEAKNWERRVIMSEKTVLTALNYDVFWHGVDWVVNAVVGTKAMAEPLAENAMALALSGHVLAAGPVLWLKYGPKYAFAAIAGFLSLDITPLFPALALQPLTVSHATELIYHSCQALSRVKRTVALQSKHALFSDSKVSLMGINIQKVQKDCATYISKHQGQRIDDSKFVSSPAYREISQRAKLRSVFRGVRSDRIEQGVLPVLSKICFESKCTIRFSDGMMEGTNDIILEGSWKALSIAEHLMCEVASLPPPVPYEQLLVSNAFSSMGAHHDFNRPSHGNVIKQVKVQPGLLEMDKIDGKNGWCGTFDSLERYDAGWKTCVAAHAPQEHLDSAGLRWWVPHQFAPSLSGSICEIFSSPKLIDNGNVDMHALALLALSSAGGYSRLQAQYPTLASFLPDTMGVEAQENNRSVAISLQRWPPEKIAMKERSTSGHENMQMGYSVAALQEMQLLHQLHFLIPSPQGHPNFILPLAIALDPDSDDSEKESSSGAASITSSKAANDILAMIERNQRAAGKKQLASGSHLVLEPTPLNLQKVMSMYQRKNNGGALIPQAVLASWCHDILSAISFCHSNHIVLRSLLPDQIHLDHSGTAKLSGLSKVMVLHGKDRTKEFDPLKYIRSKKGRDHNTEDVEPFAAPELLLGGTRHTKETDMWAFGALLANLLLGKQLFPGKDRVSKMTQVFKIVGVPGKDNYDEAKDFPFHSNNMYVIGDEGKKKKYGRAVEKAIRHMLRAFGDDHDAEFAGLISLIDELLHLDPKKRMTADDALGHQYMRNYSMQVDREEFRQKYVKDWLDLKENVLTKGKSSKSSIRDRFFVSKNKTMAGISNGGSAEKESKRKAFLVGASSGVEGDDLYNLDDLLNSSAKKPKFSEQRHDGND